MYQYIGDSVGGKGAIGGYGQSGHALLDLGPNLVQKGDTPKRVQRLRKPNLQQHRQQTVPSLDSTFPRLRDVVVIGALHAAPEMPRIVLEKPAGSEGGATQNPGPVPNLHIDRVFIDEGARLGGPAVAPGGLAPAGDEFDDTEEGVFLERARGRLDELRLGMREARARVPRSARSSDSPLRASWRRRRS